MVGFTPELHTQGISAETVFNRTPAGSCRNGSVKVKARGGAARGLAACGSIFALSSEPSSGWPQPEPHEPNEPEADWPGMFSSIPMVSKLKHEPSLGRRIDSALLESD